jgi:hypothetical protein
MAGRQQRGRAWDRPVGLLGQARRKEAEAACAALAAAGWDEEQNPRTRRYRVFRHPTDKTQRAFVGVAGALRVGPSASDSRPVSDWAWSPLGCRESAEASRGKDHAEAHRSVAMWDAAVAAWGWDRRAEEERALRAE